MKNIFLSLCLVFVFGCTGTILDNSKLKPQEIIFRGEENQSYFLNLNDFNNNYSGFIILTKTPVSMSYQYAVCYKDGTNDWRPLE